MFFSKSCYMTVLVLAACTALAQCAALESAVGTDAYMSDALDDKNENALQMHKRPSFFVGSRYGRSGAGSPSLLAPSKARRLNMVPRNDRFFLGSRYGKRAGEYMSPYEQDSSNGIGIGNGNGNAAAMHMGNTKSGNYAENNAPATPYMMSCVYTGLRNFYRCNSVEEINNIINQLTTAQTDEDKRK